MTSGAPRVRDVEKKENVRGTRGRGRGTSVLFVMRGWCARIVMILYADVPGGL